MIFKFVLRKNIHAIPLFVLFLLVIVGYIAFKYNFSNNKSSLTSNFGHSFSNLSPNPSIFSTDCVTGYFTEPNSPTGQAITAGLLQFLESAKESIYGALYDLDYEPVADVLITQRQANKEVRLVIEEENMQNSVILRCRQSGIEVKPDKNPALMHNKFFIVDRQRVWTGSTNITFNCLILNNNNSIVIDKVEVAEIYLQEFQEMFFHNLFGKGYPSTSPYPWIQCGSTEIRVLFAPEDNVENFLVEEIDKSRDRIEFLAFSLTSEGVANHLIQAKERGVIVLGVLEKRNVGQPASNNELLQKHGVTIRVDSNPKSMHHKVFIFDSTTVWTGSYNFSRNANERNDENVVILRNPSIAECYRTQFYALFETATPIH